MELCERLQKYFEEDKKDPDYQIERLLLEINEYILEALKKKGLTQKAFAEKLGVSPAYITKLLNGKPNLTLKSLIKIALALDVELKVEITDYPKTYEYKVPSDFPYSKTQIPLREIVSKPIIGEYSEPLAA